LGVLQVANPLDIRVPKQLGIFGFANEAFSEIIRPSLSSVDQISKEMGKRTAELYFNNILSTNILSRESKIRTSYKKEIIKTEIIVRESSKRK
jgi:DNA-binding LacI/PurR family transcriptional regulator